MQPHHRLLQLPQLYQRFLTTLLSSELYPLSQPPIFLKAFVSHQQISSSISCHFLVQQLPSLPHPMPWFHQINFSL
ncbi:hypothetical protein VIGAN_04046600 [Vigna angularis var. angularis]|uniref:Uncharacterized protein n=1 Tax=Vigna angularis var. angularis TaxID=157739 RepID=A0A0S3RRX6_PHAAN|nr:hypothetical protein VIGAN_04046600 [Vigna angularis var. angularis]